jgi:hypothetical protein
MMRKIGKGSRATTLLIPIALAARISYALAPVLQEMPAGQAPARP